MVQISGKRDPNGFPNSFTGYGNKFEVHGNILCMIKLHCFQNRNSKNEAAEVP